MGAQVVIAMLLCNPLKLVEGTDVYMMPRASHCEAGTMMPTG